jgi:uncharacterized protein
MLKNKFVLGFLFLALVAIIVYSLNTQEDFNARSLKDRAAYQENLRSMDDSPLRNAKLTSLFDFFDPAESWLIEADFVPQTDGKEFTLQMTDSSSQGLKMAGKASFVKDGKKTELMLFEEGETFLLPFRDLTSGKETYGGGRYINVPKKDLLGGKLTIDFNKAHNFYCAYSPKYICPIPPRENMINLEVKAGEKTFKH